MLIKHKTQTWSTVTCTLHISSNKEFQPPPKERRPLKERSSPIQQVHANLKQTVLGLCRVSLTRSMDTDLKSLSPTFFMILSRLVFYLTSEVMILHKIQIALKVSSLYTGKWKLEIKTLNKKTTSNPPLLTTFLSYNLTIFKPILHFCIEGDVLWILYTSVCTFV